MEIILLRHGKPDHPLDQRISIRELPQTISGYNQAGVSESAPDDSCGMASSCEYVVCSDLPRSLQSAQLLGVDNIHLSSPLFREVDLPVSIWPSPRMSTRFWFGFFRVLWFFGHRADGESLTQARLRAVQGMQALTALAQRHGRILFVGHGVLNQFIARELVSSGWSGPKSPGRHYWDYGCYRLGE